MAVQYTLSAEGAASMGCFSKWNPPSSTLPAQVICMSCEMSNQVTTGKCVLQVAKEARASAEEQLAAAKEEICQLTTQQQAAYAARVADLEWALQVGRICMSGVSRCSSGTVSSETRRIMWEGLVGMHGPKQERHSAPREGT